MVTLPVPTPALISVAIAGAISAQELLGWFILCPRFSRLLPFQRPVDPGLPTPAGPALDQPARGSGEQVTWRWHPGSRALLFRRRITPGRKPYSMGRLHLGRDGRWSLRWAPIPFFSWPAACAAWFAWLLGIGWADSPGGGVIMAMASGLFLSVVLANLYISRRSFDRVVWPELQRQLREWLG